MFLLYGGPLQGRQDQQQGRILAVSDASSASSSRFLVPADNRRPFHCHRYEVWSPKLRRRIRLYHEISLDMWVLLEADPQVRAFCERPIVVKGDARNIVVDFWVQRVTQEELLILPRSKKSKPTLQTKPDTLDPHLKNWAHAQEIHLREVTLDEIRRNPIFLSNWKAIIHYLAANNSLLQSDVLLRVREFFSTRGEARIEEIQRQFENDDPILVRSAVFALLRQGVVRSDDLNTAPLGLSTRISVA